jgi:fumarylacetoacetate (FAA) hydrolase
MKLVSFLNNRSKERAGIFFNDRVYDLKQSGKLFDLKFPSRIKKLLNYWDEYLPLLKKLSYEIEKKDLETGINISEIKLLSPVPHPTSCRDGYAFRQHVAAARRNRGVEMIPEFDQYPIFYFTNHNAVFGPGEIIVEDDHLKSLDFELEAAIVICKRGKNIPAEKADEYIAGYMVMNDFSARVLQMEEMKLNLGPAKGKDFATSFGPWLVTLDELENYKIPSSFGDKYDLEMRAIHNGKIVSHGNMKDMNWTFAELIERASYGVELFPGDIIGSGTVGTGCYLELNGTWAREAKEKGESFTPIWLRNGDTIELEITGLGKLINKIVKSSESNSILRKKKNN